MMKVYFITHATTEDNETGIASGWHDTKLSRLGIQQSKEQGERFRDIKVDFICCSDLNRAIETVKIAFGDKIPVITDWRLREINYGDLNGKPADIVDPMNKGKIDEPFPSGESYEQAIARIHDFCHEILENHDEKVILIVGSRAIQFGLDTFIGNRTIKDCLNVPFIWQQSWVYVLTRREITLSPNYS